MKNQGQESSVISAELLMIEESLTHTEEGGDILYMNKEQEEAIELMIAKGLVENPAKITDEQQQKVVLEMAARAEGKTIHRCGNCGQLMRIPLEDFVDGFVTVTCPRCKSVGLCLSDEGHVMEEEEEESE
jgi:phage FluMu protein Com